MDRNISGFIQFLCRKYSRALAVAFASLYCPLSTRDVGSAENRRKFSEIPN
jgi:hypothetical protein